MNDPTTSRLLAGRVELLDLSLRNPLLNYRGSNRRGLEIIDERSSQVFSELVVAAAPLRFHHTRAVPSKEDRSETAIFFLDEGAAAEKQVGVGDANPENSLATPYTKEGLAERLLATFSDARLTIEEQGANTLFLTLGMLRWRDPNEPEQDRLAPLVLIPVRLERKSARSFWQLAATDEEPGANLSLVEKLKDVGIKLPAEPDLETVEQLEAFFALVEQSVAEKPGWGIDRDRVVLGFFSFGKFLMYRDLDPAIWPPENPPGRHPILAGLLGEGFRDSGPAAPQGPMDERRPPGKTMEVMDADGSQAEALAEVAGGRTLVIQGPPGTGKSQTISNLIAEAVFSGKTVLFVAEKRAALEVVKRRLENIGLGELCLELHSNKASKKEVSADLARTLALGKPLAPGGADLVDGLPALRDRLNRYARAVALPVAQTEVSPYQAVGILERLRKEPEPLPRLTLPVLKEWAAATYRDARSRVQDLATKIGDIGVPANHPFDGVGLTEFLPGDQEKIEAALRDAASSTRGAIAASEELAGHFKLPRAMDATTLDAWCQFGTLALEAPDLKGVPPIGPLWENAEVHASVGAAVKAGLELSELRKANASRLGPHAWDAEVSEARTALVSDGTSFWSRLFSSRYRAARRQIQGLCAPPPPKKPFDLVLVTDAILKARNYKGEIEKRGERAKDLFGTKWQGADSSWEDLRAIRDWALRFCSLRIAKKLPPQLGEWAVGSWDRQAFRMSLQRAKDALEKHRAAWRKVASLLAWMSDDYGAFPEDDFPGAVARADRWGRELGRLPSYVGYWKIRQDVVGRGLGDLVKPAHEGTLKAAALAAALEKSWAERILDQAFRERPELREFDAVTHEQAVERFRRADAATFTVNRARLAERHWTSLPGRVGYGQVGLLRHECAKKARFLPVRRLIEQAGRALQAAKPVFLMSPLSVAAFLPPESVTFDLVVFDEASQVKPVDAFGSILRGRQLVVVGDEKQMPPTSFFDTLLAEGRVTDPDEAVTENVTQDLQSILGMCTARGVPSRMLRWHYRSRHDSLIAVSNCQFYDNRLIVFPSPDRGRGAEGLVFNHLPNTVYERGTSRANPLEAEAVVEAVVAHSRATPHLTLGVVAFSQAQREAVYYRIEQRRRKDADFDAFIGAARDEPFFVKNLENVQGDERDVILISVGYGRDAGGTTTMNFGPLNQAGGERRLNVLITRARRKCVVFTNLTADDLDLRRAPGIGVRVLKAFLAYAEKGQLDVPRSTGAGHDSDFEEEVHGALAKLGFEIEAQVGSGGYRIDLAVVDPRAKGRYLLGIECDGASYHAAPWARDRDRLRESVLRGLGWRIHRIWSADWFRNREEAIRRCVEAIDGAKKAREARAEASKEPPLRREDDLSPAGPQAAEAYAPAKVRAKIGDVHLADVDTATLARFIAEIVEREGPLHREELQRRILDAIDQRAGSKKLAAIDEALALGTSRGLLRARGEFLWGKEDRPVVPRDRSQLPDASRALELVCDEECRAALLRVVDEARGCAGEEAAVQAIKLLGVKRNEAAMTRLGGLIGGLVSEGTLSRTRVGALAKGAGKPA